MTRIKICGITDQRDALEAVHLGVDAVGFVLSRKSPRWIPPREAARIGSRLPPFVARVGVFIDEPADLVADSIHAAGLTALQFHGSEPPDYCRRFALPWFKSFRLAAGFDPEALSQYACTTYFLALDDDGAVAGGPLRNGPGSDAGRSEQDRGEGGRDDSRPWAEAAAAGRYGRIILGGALGPGEVGRAIEATRPYAVDASTGVEFAPGKPDIDRLEAFIEAVRVADARLRLFDRRD